MERKIEEIVKYCPLRCVWNSVIGRVSWFHYV